MNREKYTLISIFLLIFLFFLLTISMLTSNSAIEEYEHYRDGTGIISFYVQSADSDNSNRSILTPNSYMISWLEINSIHYLMIPNSADINRLRIYFNASAPVFAESYELISGEYTDIFANRNGNSLTLISDGYSYEVIALEGSEIATLFIQTESGNLDYIHASRSNRETAQILMICADGETILYDGIADRFNGRGNSTWSQPKKPYNIRLVEATDLLGIGDAQHRHWTLLAEFLDNSRMRNIISHHLAQQVGLEAAIRFRPVEVYINNEYKGLYLLTERASRIDTVLPITDLEAATAEVNLGRLSDFEHLGDMEFAPGARKYFDIPNNPSDISGGYLLELQFSVRYNREPSGFVTNRGQTFLLRAPTHASKAQVDYISTFMQELEDAVYSETGYNSLGKHFTEYLDMRSFAEMYVFQEFIMNLDAAWSSFFFYKESDLVGDGLLRAAPPWDFDQSLGILGANNNADLSEGFRIADPEVFRLNRGNIAFHPEGMPHIINALWQHGSFRDLAMEVWNETFVPIIEANFFENIHEYERLISNSIKMEWIRWEMNVSHQQEVDAITEFIERRINFLNREWSN